MNIVLVHGGFVDGSGWEGVYRILKQRGHACSIVQNPTISLAGDVAATKLIIALQDGPTVLVGHSYGGAVISEAGNDPKVAKLVYIAAFAPDKGESVSSLIKDPPLGIPHNRRQSRIPKTLSFSSTHRAQNLLKFAVTVYDRGGFRLRVFASVHPQISGLRPINPLRSLTPTSLRHQTRVLFPYPIPARRPPFPPLVLRHRGNGRAAHPKSGRECLHQVAPTPPLQHPLAGLRLEPPARVQGKG